MGKKNKSNKKHRINIKKLIILLLFILVIGLLVFGVLKSFKKEKPVETKVVDKIKIGYVVNDKDTKYFKETFKELKTLLTGKNVDEQKHAELIAKLFIIDFYSLGNKTSKNDIGGVQFVVESAKTDFVDSARDTLYKLVKNSLDDEKNDLPIVEEVTIDSVEKVSLSEVFDNSEGLLDIEGKEGYKVKLTWTYNKDTKLQSSATLIVMPDGEKLSVGRLY